MRTEGNQKGGSITAMPDRTCLYLIVDRTWWTVEQPLAPPSPPGTFWDVILAGTERWLATGADGASVALQYEPRITPPGQTDPYHPPAVDFTANAADLLSSLQAEDRTSLRTADALISLLNVAIEHIQTSPACAGAAAGVVLITRYAHESVNLIVQRAPTSPVAIFVVSSTPSQSPHAKALERVARAQRPQDDPYWVNDADGFATAMSAIAKRVRSQ
jgi:hypothetical protein